ncbi:MAG: CHAT domain-containing protein, partial [Microcoleus sp. SIO2G3]|nr:CHAT domain-containing protein [Microcoleus sp. SIO2G3]
MAQEFHISVTPLGEDEYLVRIERVAPGVPLAEEQVKWPVKDWLAQARQLMNDPLLGVLQGNSAFTNELFYSPEWEEPVSQSSLNLVALGQQLYNALFQGSLRDSWMMAQAIAQNQRSILRLRLGLKGQRLPRLPWEVLYAGDRPLATGTDVVFSRYQLSTGRISPVHALPSGSNQPLKILMVIASPSDQETLELAEEASQLQAELRSRSPNELPAIQLTILEQPGREQLTQALEQGQYQVFHYAGHSNLGDSGGDVYLVSNKTGLTETLNGADLAGLLVNNGIQLAVFNSCRGAYTAPSERANGKDRNLAEAIVARGIPGVLAMAERIPDEVALTLTRLLYRNLNQGYPIDLSLSRARQGLISAYGSNQLYWALPVLYLHPEFDGFLTKVDDAAQTIAELFAIAEPPEASLSPHAALFTPPTGRGISPSYLEIEEELDGLSPEDLAEDEGFVDDLDYDDLDADDPGAFIQDLLRQLEPKPTSSNMGQTNTGIESLPPVTSETGDLEPPRHPVNNQSPAPTESGGTTPTTETPQSLSGQSEEPKIPSGGSSGKLSGFQGWSQNWQRFPKLWVIFGAIGVIAIALLGFWFFQRQHSLDTLSQPPANVPTVPLSQT